MADLISQNKRLFSFKSPMGDKLLCNRFAGTEEISQSFEFNLELVSEDFNISWEKMLGKNVTVGIRHLDGKTFRYFNGHISKFAPIRHDGRLAYYSAEMVPWTWFLTLTRNCLIYQKKTVEYVIRDTFKKFGFKNFRFDLRHADWHSEWEYCCQYRETSFDFISRLMEIEGMYYYFKHEDGKHTLTIVDDKTSHVPCDQQSTFRYEHSVGAGVVRNEGTIFAAEMRKVVKPSKYFHKEFNFTMPDSPLLYGSDDESAAKSIDQLYVFDYPGEFEKQDEGIFWSKVRQESQEYDRIESRGKCNSRALLPGYRFNLTQHDREEQNVDYMLLSVTHEAEEGTLLPGSDMSTARYENNYVAMLSENQFRPKRETPLHRMAGAQTAIVVGPKNEEIHTDEYGRVRVRFHWDRAETTGEDSCWIRVMQPWAGPGYGHVWIPRVGQEVIVDFLEGDPDRPIITGTVYNKKNRQPYQPLPDKKNWSGIKTRSTIGGTEKNYNELRFIDTKDQELYVMHAEKDMEITVNHDTNEVVDHDRSLEVKHDQVEKVGNSKHSTVKKNKYETVEGDKHNYVNGEFRETIDDDMSLHVKGEVKEKADERFLLESGGDVHIKAGGRIILEGRGGILFLGKGAWIDVTDQVIIEGQRILLNCGLPPPPGAMDANPEVPDAATFAQSLFGQDAGSGVGAFGAQAFQDAMQQGLAQNPYVAGVLGDTPGAGGVSMPGMPSVPSMPSMPSVPSLPSLPGAPDLGGLAGQLAGELAGAASQAMNELAASLGVSTSESEAGAPTAADQIAGEGESDSGGEPDVLA